MPLDADDKKFIADLIKSNNEELGKQFVTADEATKMVNQGLSSGLKEAGLDKVGETLGGITERLEKLGKAGGDGGGEGEGGGKKGGDGAVDPAVARLQEQLENLQRQNQQAEEARKQAEAARRDTLLDNQIRAGLSKAGIPSDRHDQAIAYLRTIKAADGEPVLRFKDDGTPVYVAQRKGYVDTLDVVEGLTEWASTDAAKVYLPPTGANGTGDGAGGRGNGGGGGSAPRDENGRVDWGAIGARVKLDPTDTEAA